MKKYTGGQLQQQIIDLARIRGWKAAHFRPALTKHGWRTPVSADGKGFPDLFLVRPPRLLAFECKGKYEKLSPEQAEWLKIMSMAGITATMVKPDDWEMIEELLA